MHILIVHGWKGSPEIAWFPWLISELKKAGHQVEPLYLPHPFIPDRWTWTREVKRALDRSIPEETIIIAHSIGCPTTLFALQSYNGNPFHRVVLVSGFAKPFPVPFVHTWFFGAKLDLESIKPKARSWYVIHGEKDPLVPFKRGCELAEALGVSCESICDGGHFTPQEKCLELPEVLRAVVK
jgi:predicted alpha/beta hydrolase family esterase